MMNDVRRHVRSCHDCQTRKAVPVKPAGELQLIRATQPFETIGIDLLGPFPLSNSGNKHIVVADDYVTKWAIV